MLTAPAAEEDDMKRSDPKIEKLRALPAMRGVSDKDLARLASLVDEAQLPAGHILTREGAPARECFMVLDGQAEVIVQGETVGAAGPGEFVGEMGLLDIRPRTATVRAVTPMTVFVIDPQHFGQVLEDKHLARTMLHNLSERLRRVEGPTPANT
jgi:CRP-like cAMP-binding protein